MTIEEAARILRIDPRIATEDVVRQARRILAKGMDTENTLTKEKMQELNEAVNVLNSAISGRGGKTDKVFIEDTKEPMLQISNVEEQMQSTIQRMRKIFDMQREELINNGPFNSEDLEAFYAKYHKLITEANEELLRLREYKKSIKTPADILDQAKKDNLLNRVSPYQRENTVREKQLPAVLENKKDFDSESVENTDQNALEGPTLEDMRLALEDHQMKKENDTLGLPGPTLKDAKLGLPDLSQDRGLYQIVHDLTKGLRIKKDDHKTLRGSKIQVMRNFQQGLQSGNVTYNVVHFAPAVLAVPFQLLTKLRYGIFANENTKKRIETLKQRVDNLSKADLKTIYESYRSNRVTQEKYPMVLNDLLNNKVHSYVMEKVTQLNTDAKKGYLNIFSTCRKLDALNDMLKRSDIEEATHKKLEQQKMKILAGKAEVVKQIRQCQKEAREYLSGGLHGFEEDMKAAESKMSYVGRRFAKTYDMDEVLAQKQAQAEREENYAVRTENDELAFQAFIKNETLLSEHTKMKESILGKISAGKKDYNPLAEMLNYRPDPFIRDLFTTIAITSAAYSAASGLMNEKNIVESQKDMNAHNEEVIGQINEAGRDIRDKADTFQEGMRAQSNQAIQGASNTIERAVLDKNKWQIGSDGYHIDDAMGHDFYNSLYQDTENAFASVASEYAKGAISKQDALGAFTDIARGTQDHLNQVYDACKPIMESYAKKNPRFDLQGSLNTMDYLVKNPTSIADMNQAMFETVGIGENLAGLSAEQLGVLNELPTDLSATLLNATATAAFATSIASSMETNEKTGKYGNEVTQMVEEYVASTKEAPSVNLGAKAA